MDNKPQTRKQSLKLNIGTKLALKLSVTILAGVLAASTTEAAQVVVNASPSARTVDSRHFALNAAIWDSYFDEPANLALLRDLGATAFRFPGGSISDEYHWAVNRTGTNTFSWANSFTDFARVVTNLGAQAIITVNYGSGTPEEAAAWVRHANVTNLYGFKYWEIGNECYGTWENDTNNLPHHAFTYATRAAACFAQMKAVDPAGRLLRITREPDLIVTRRTRLAVDASGNAYVTGTTFHPPTYNDVATVKYDPSGNRLWRVDYAAPGLSRNSGSAVAVDGLGDVHVTGEATALLRPGTDLLVLHYRQPDLSGAFHIGLVRQSDGSLRFALPPGTNFVIEASSNLIQWSRPAMGEIDDLLPLRMPDSKRFFRLVRPGGF